jgi:hypothetical protein
MYEYLFEIVEWSVIMARAYLMQWVGKNTSFFYQGNVSKHRGILPVYFM